MNEIYIAIDDLPAIAIRKCDYVFFIVFIKRNDSLTNVMNTNRQTKKFGFRPNIGAKADLLLNVFSVETGN